MHERSQQLADRVAEQLDLTTRFVAELDDTDLRVCCNDEGGGPSVGAVILHIVAGFQRASAMFAAAARPGRRGIEHRRPHREQPGHSAGAPLADLDSLDVPLALQRLRAHGELAVATLRRLPDRVLDEPLPPESCTIANVGKPVGLVVEFIVYQQAVHLDAMKRAVMAARGARA